jgi:5S rRNA maturation endonuclease (ribonuclease M5)
MVTGSPDVTAGGAAAADGRRMLAIRLRDVRSVWGAPIEVPIGASVTVLVGPNRAGTSNVAWALAAALDERIAFEPGRDLPRRRADPRPEARVLGARGARGTVTWDPDDGTRTVSGRVPTGHVVLAPVEATPRDLLRSAPLDLSEVAGRKRLATVILEVARAVLPEVERVAIDRRLAVSVHDDLGSTVPVPETRALTALAVARQLAVLGTPPAAVVVEAPEVFLHPAGQEAVAQLLLEVAADTGAPVIVTTTSPFTIPRVAATTVVALARDADGRTGVEGTAKGDAAQAPLLGGLLRDAGLAAVLDRVSSIPAQARGVLIVEGGTDEAYLRQAADTLGRGDELADLEIRPSGGAMAAATAAIVLRAELEIPLLVLLDHDGPGRRARDTLVSRFGLDRRREVLTYADVFEGGPLGVEAETLFDPGLVRRFVHERGPAASHGERELQHDLVHVDLTSSGKSAFVGWLRGRVRPVHLDRWAALLDLIAERLA